ncbi:MAG: UxaA family hydrolase [Candidatus Bipolaricaulis sp.]|nr:UxaA family hydrolase [Candidatus Bipolaricaulis sp.]
MKTSVLGYWRKDGTIGVRNHVAVIATVLCSRHVAEEIARQTGAVAITHERGCLELGDTKAHTELVLRNAIGHPNIGAALVVGLGCEQVSARRLAETEAGKPVRWIDIRATGGTTKAIAVGIKLARALSKEIEGRARERAGLDELVVATQCGSSDTAAGIASNPAVGIVADWVVHAGGTVILGETPSLYGAAGVLAERAATPDTAARILEITDNIERYYARMGRSLREANPTPGNIERGLTTLVEKSLGGIRKAGTTPIKGVVRPAERVCGKGLWIMDTSLGLGTHVSTDMLCGGAQVMLYTTGGGNPMGSPLGPVIKIAATPDTVAAMQDSLDFDASPVIQGTETLAECGERLVSCLLDVVNGKPTKAEQLGSYAFAIGTIAS